MVLYDQDFETPSSYQNDGGDLNIYRSVNENYGGQPAGFSFAQAFTVETLNVSGSHRRGGTAAFGSGWSDPAGIGGNFSIGMLSDRQNDLLGLSFDVGLFDFFNVSIDVSSIDLSTFGGPYVPEDGLAPIFRFSLFDNPGGGRRLAAGPCSTASILSARHHRERSSIGRPACSASARQETQTAMSRFKSTCCRGDMLRLIISF
ncbi:hypothetical protein JMK10_19915 [Rhodovulum sulfidophilum]|uniref:hypothetical protein n=1 Tax=Rhodovulum sulfidophilum TaxID=35806 RepID=UPI0019213D33|nr:hypothetical protein [Rhodovulum sulfidophilum]MBL3576298.1 hypothetical protein [Rhodovulum sulfidophilum]MCE8433668.1 hypothetical protein [Rhodovulum sulfidophilum]MCF4118976.1 hypothetical protein [Rhodovulum sulfidophilum]